MCFAVILEAMEGKVITFFDISIEFWHSLYLHNMLRPKCFLFLAPVWKITIHYEMNDWEN